MTATHIQTVSHNLHQNRSLACRAHQSGISGYQEWIRLVLTLEYIASSVNIRIIDVTPYGLRVNKQ